MCVDANEMGPLFLKEVLNFIYGKRGTRNNFGAIRRRGAARGGTDISYAGSVETSPHAICSSVLYPTCFESVLDLRQPLFIYTSQSPLFAFVLAPKLMYTPTQTALHRRLPHSVYLKPRGSTFTHRQQEAQLQSSHLLYDTLVIRWWYARRQCFPTIICRYEAVKWYLCFGRHCSDLHCLENQPVSSDVYKFIALTLKSPN